MSSSPWLTTWKIACSRWRRSRTKLYAAVLDLDATWNTARQKNQDLDAATKLASAAQKAYDDLVANRTATLLKLVAALPPAPAPCTEAPGDIRLSRAAPGVVAHEQVHGHRGSRRHPGRRPLDRDEERYRREPHEHSSAPRTTSRSSLPTTSTRNNQDSAKLSLYLYRVVENPYNKNDPPVPGNGSSLRKTPLAIDLYYLVTPRLGKARDHHIVLGKVLQVFYDRCELQGADLVSPPASSRAVTPRSG